MNGEPKRSNGARYFRIWLITAAGLFVVLVAATQFLPGGTRCFFDWLPALFFLLEVSVMTATLVVVVWVIICRRLYLQAIIAIFGVALATGLIQFHQWWSRWGGSGPSPPALTTKTNQVRLTVNATQVLRTVDSRWFGVNAPVWDALLNTPDTLADLRELGVHALRFGNFFDEYHWASGLIGTNRQPPPVSYMDFASVASNIRAQVFITVNYGSATAAEAAGWVRHANVTNHLGLKYWIIGNENYGAWEHDENSPPHDPVTYATRAAEFIRQMRAADPSIKIGVPASITWRDRGSVTSEALSRLDLVQFIREGFLGWTPKLLATLKELGVAPDFLDIHRYPENPGWENDAFLLRSTRQWAADAAELRRELRSYYGDAATNIELLCTENNSVGGNTGKQTTSLVGALYLADSFGQLTQTEINSWCWWDLRNAQDRTSNNSSKLYGWRVYGDHGLMSGKDTRYPTFYTFKLLQYFARDGDRIIHAASDDKNLSIYAAKRGDGSVALLVINKTPNTMMNATIALTGFKPQAQATIYSYGIPQDEAARTGEGSQDIAKSTLTNAAMEFPCSFTPYSATAVILRAAPVNPRSMMPVASTFR